MSNSISHGVTASVTPNAIGLTESSPAHPHPQPQPNANIPGSDPAHLRAPGCGDGRIEGLGVAERAGNAQVTK